MSSYDQILYLVIHLWEENSNEFNSESMEGHCNEQKTTDPDFSCLIYSADLQWCIFKSVLGPLWYS
ncbi:hypothetical protein BPJM79_20010 [Bacillus pumilus]